MCINVSMIVKHLYQRKVARNGKTVKVWYFWFWKDGKQVRRSCGTSVKREAEAYIAGLSEDELLGAEKKETADIKLKDFCSGMFDADSDYLTKQHNRGIDYHEKTRRQKATNLNDILGRFGEFSVRDISAGIIDDWLLRQKRSNSWRNGLISIFNVIFNELYLYNLIDRIPELKNYKRVDQREKGILFPDEISMLFPDNTEELLKVWHIWNGESEAQDFVSATAVYTALTTGMRSGEIRALKYPQFIREDAILLNASFDALGKRVERLKKGNDRNKKWRIAVLPERTVRMIKTMRLLENSKQTDFVFEYHGHAYGPEYLSNHFKSVLRHNGIDAEERNISFHSLRFTYDTMMNREISTDDLMLMMGHSSRQMTEYYDKSKVTDHLPQLLENKAVIDSVWK
mgnify:CR=1 FL=1